MADFNANTSSLSLSAGSDDLYVISFVPYPSFTSTDCSSFDLAYQNPFKVSFPNNYNTCVPADTIKTHEGFPPAQVTTVTYTLSTSLTRRPHLSIIRRCQSVHPPSTTFPTSRLHIAQPLPYPLSYFLLTHVIPSCTPPSRPLAPLLNPRRAVLPLRRNVPSRKCQFKNYALNPTRESIFQCPVVGCEYIKGTSTLQTLNATS